MRLQGLRFLVGVAIMRGIAAQSVTVGDLGSLLEEENKLTMFYGLIQKYPEILLRLPSYSGVTILAPSNSAFDKIPYTSLNTIFASNSSEAIVPLLEYHILSGTYPTTSLVPGVPQFPPSLLTSPLYTNISTGQVVQGIKQAGNIIVYVSGEGSRSTLSTPDLKFLGGIVQIIDSFLIPPSNLSSTTQMFALNSFLGAVYAADLANEIDSASNITIFAPSNSAFQSLGPAISNMTSSQLSQVLTYHLVPQLLYSPDLKNRSNITTYLGSTISITRNGNDVFVNSAKVLTEDILFTNGVIHILDNVLNPEAPSVKPDPAVDTQSPVFGGASSVENVLFTSAIPCSTSCPVTTTTAVSESATGAASGQGGTATETFRSNSSKAGAQRARETGDLTRGMLAVVGGVALLI